MLEYIPCGPNNNFLLDFRMYPIRGRFVLVSGAPAPRTDGSDDAFFGPRAPPLYRDYSTTVYVKFTF